jgi:GTP-binding protein EngB required for normal cell division
VFNHTQLNGMPEETANPLNSSHQRRLTVTCRYIDKLLADMEGTLHVSESKLAFPHYRPDLSPPQRRVIEDYIRRIRAQLIRVLDGQNIERPSPDIPESRSLRTVLSFIDVAAEELKPEYMRGYGELPPVAAVELNGIAGELQGLVGQVDQFLIRGSKEDLQRRLESLEPTGDELALLKKLESVITRHGLVEFRLILSMIIDRLEDNRFEIAIFGRVNSGKSSLLNAILETDVLPVGVTPITAVPTLLMYGDSPAVNVWFANRSPERFAITHLSEFVTEQFNPNNQKHVSRIVVQLPSERLQGGVAFVDTPGLGSLVPSGAAETLAYLPRCDLGIVMMDAASTLTPDDLQTIQTLYQSGIPATILLNKADLLSSDDRTRVVEYMKEQVQKGLNLVRNVRAVSTVAEHRARLHHWFEADIAPLYHQCQDLKVRSVGRKIDVLRQSIEAVLRARLHQKQQLSPQRVEQLRFVEAELRQANGRIEEMKRTARDLLRELEYAGPQFIRIATATLLEAWSVGETEDNDAAVIISNSIVRAIGERTEALPRRIHALAQKLYETVQSAAPVLETEDVPSEQEFPNVIREMPVFEPSRFEVGIRKPMLASLFGAKTVNSVVRRQLAVAIGHQLKNSLGRYQTLLYAWSQRTLSQMQRRFDAYANSYRAQIERWLFSQQEPGVADEAIQRDLEAIQTRRTVTPRASGRNGCGESWLPHEEERNRTAC